MGLVVAQLLFVEHPEADSVRLDLIVLDRAEAGASPPVGSPIAFCFGMPADPDERSRVQTVLENWARREATLDITIRIRRGVDEVVLCNGVAAITLQPQVPHGTAGET